MYYHFDINFALFAILVLIVKNSMAANKPREILISLCKKEAYNNVNITRECVYETLCPQLVTHFQDVKMTKFKL